MAYIDPTKHKVSDYLLLSDLMGCDSVYRYGYRNRISDNEQTKLKEAQNLGETLDLLQDSGLGPYAISYGHISDELSCNIVRYQDPKKPSYHRWELGAAADVWFPDAVEEDGAPIYVAHRIHRILESYARMITYAESPWICFATSLIPDRTDNKAFYENRYIPGERKPKFITYSRKNREMQFKQVQVGPEWKGQGYPSYHGGGRKQYHHDYYGNYCHKGMFLYDKYLTHNGVKNLPPHTDKYLMHRWRKCAVMAASAHSVLVECTGHRVSILRAYNRTKEQMRWRDYFTMEVETHESPEKTEQLADILEDCISVRYARPNGSRLMIKGVNI